jgi:hypothetical protein
VSTKQNTKQHKAIGSGDVGNVSWSGFGLTDVCLPVYVAGRLAGVNMVRVMDRLRQSSLPDSSLTNLNLTSFAQQENHPAATGDYKYYVYVIHGHFCRGRYIFRYGKSSLAF